MDHADLYQLRETYSAKHMLLCFNGPFSQGLIEEIGHALKKCMGSEAASSSSALDVFAVYIEIAQNIQHYSTAHGYSDAEASATVVISRDEAGHYEVSAGNIVEVDDGEALAERIQALAALDKTELKAAYKAQLRKPREDNAEGAGLGLLDIARKSSLPCSCSLHPLDDATRYFFSLRVVI